jgi:hypothetical protein
VHKNPRNDPGTTGNLQEFGPKVQASNPRETEAHVKMKSQETKPNLPNQT